MGWSWPLHTETPANKCEQAWWAPFPTHWEVWPSVTLCQQLKRLLTCLPFAGCTRLCPPLSAQSSMQTSSAWGSSGGCAPERSKVQFLKEMLLIHWAWQPISFHGALGACLLLGRALTAQKSMSPRPVRSYSSRSKGPGKKNCFSFFWYSSSTPK